MKQSVGEVSALSKRNNGGECIPECRIACSRPREAADLARDLGRMLEFGHATSGTVAAAWISRSGGGWTMGASPAWLSLHVRHGDTDCHASPELARALPHVSPKHAIRALRQPAVRLAQRPSSVMVTHGRPPGGSSPSTLGGSASGPLIALHYPLPRGNAGRRELPKICGAPRRSLTIPPRQACSDQLHSDRRRAERQCARPKST